MGLLAALVLLLALRPDATAATGSSLAGTAFDPVGLSRLDSLVEAHVTDARIAGAVVLLSRHGVVGHFAAYGMADVARGVPMERDALFRVASMSKPIVAAAALCLIESGDLALEAPLTDYLPEMTDLQVAIDGDTPTIVDARPAPTIRHLLTHTAGFDYGGPDYYRAGIGQGLYPTDGTVGDIVLRLARLPLRHHPGAAFTYGLSYDVLGRVLEVASGQTLEEVVATHITGPLRMRDTGFRVAADQLPRVARTYRLDADAGLVAAGNDREHLAQQTYYSGGAGLVSTAADYQQFLRMILAGGQLDGERVLRAGSVALMTTKAIGDLSAPFPEASGDKYGLGFGIRSADDRFAGPEAPGTLMWDGYLYTRFWADPQRRFIGIFLTQTEANWGSDLIGRVRALAYDSLLPYSPERP